MSYIKIWSDEDMEEVVQLIVKILNENENRKKLMEKVEQRTGIKEKHVFDKFESVNCSETNCIGIKLFSRTNNDIGSIIDRHLNKEFIIAILPNLISRAFSAFNSLKETCIGSNKNILDNKKIKFSEYGLKIAVFIESLIYTYLEKLLDELKNDYKTNTNNISRWASPYYIKDKIQRLNNQLLYELNQYGISSFKTWLGEEMRDKIFKYIKKKDYQGLFIDNSSKKLREKNIRFITLEGDEISDEIFSYFKSIEQIPHELNAKLNFNLNILSKSFHIILLEPSKIGFTINKETKTHIPGSQIGLIYFPCKNDVYVNCESFRSGKSVEFEISDDKLLFIDLNKNKYTFKNRSLEMVTYCILTYIFAPT